MTILRSRPLGLMAFLLAFPLIVGCGKLGTAVMLWPPEGSRWEPGQLVVVKDESFLRDTYIVNIPGQRRLKEEEEREETEGEEMNFHYHREDDEGRLEESCPFYFS